MNSAPHLTPLQIAAELFNALLPIVLVGGGIPFAIGLASAIRKLVLEIRQDRLSEPANFPSSDEKAKKPPVDESYDRDFDYQSVGPVTSADYPDERGE